ncbi:MAG: hypothetical protein ABSA53_05330 [Streptosporangiaceae bacterium]
MELRVIDLETELSEWRESRAREGAAPGSSQEAAEPAPGRTAAFRRTDGADGGDGADGAGRRPPREFLRAASSPQHERDSDRTSGPRPRRVPAAGHARPIPQAGQRVPAAGHTRPLPQAGRRPADDRTQALIDRGRRAARPSRSRRGRKIAIASAVGLVVLTIGAMVVFRKGPSWPPSVAIVQSEIAVACQNPDVAAEPGQVNFACAEDTRQVLWVFALLTSNDNPGYADAKTGRKGLEPITAIQGGEIAWSLNLHHPYNPLNAVDSLEVAARAIDNIIGGATLTGSNGNPAVQPGLESEPANCARYTGSSAIITHAGFPSLCASPVISPAGQAALVADVYKQWMVGATAVAAQDASVLFQNASNPGDPQVQAVLQTLPDQGR